MQQGLEAMTTAVRVLSAMAAGQEPALHDVWELRRLAPHSAAAPLDELACEVIQQALKRRAALREVEQAKR
jgi:hypothetical protein